ncbi:MAG: protein-L-isoaspartate(D-aspartate) O-methyltransferase [Caulobacterales bacterium]|nr:protein-L-isoaspartate(D-aspartate) O-methyltransferase [Caulobacterales bacterium]
MDLGPTMRWAMAACAVIAAGAGAGEAQRETAASHAAERAQMVEIIEQLAWSARGEAGMPDAISEPVLEAMRAVPRHELVPAGVRSLAYADTPLPIGSRQTISQPFIVALMTELSGAGPGSNVLEVGTGSGYQAAVLAELGARVRSIEIIPELGERAAADLARLGYDGVETRIGDGYAGWPEAAPFDAILVTAAAEHAPTPLIEQLAPGGRLVIPVGPHDGGQDLQVIAKDAGGAVSTTHVTAVRFVPLTRED